MAHTYEATYEELNCIGRGNFGKSDLCSRPELNCRMFRFRLGRHAQRGAAEICGKESRA